MYKKIDAKKSCFDFSIFYNCFIYNQNKCDIITYIHKHVLIWYPWLESSIMGFGLSFCPLFLFVTTCSGTMVFIVYNLFTYLFNPRIHTCKVVSELLSCCPVMKKLYKPEYSIYVVIVFEYHCFPKLLWSALFIPTHFNKVMSYICNTVRVICHSLHSTLPGFPQHFCWLKKIYIIKFTLCG